MNGSKPWYSSTGVWGSVASMVVGLVGLCHLHPDAQWVGDFTAWLTSLGPIIAGFIALWGRLRATKQIGAAPKTDAAAKLVLLAFLVAAMGFAAAGCQANGGSATTQPAQGGGPDATQRLSLATQGATFTLNTIANARDAGFLSQAELNGWKPVVDAFAAARNEARRELGAGNTSAYEAAYAQLTAAYAQLQPLLQQIAARQGPPATRPAK